LVVDIPEEVVAVGVAVGRFRNQISALQHRKTRSHSGDPSGRWSIAGSIGEALVLWSYPVIGKAWVWGAINSTKTWRDVGPFEVQVTMRQSRDLILREADLRQGIEESTPYIGIYLQASSEDHATCDWQGEILGWMRLGEGIAHQDAKRMYNTRDVWLLAPELLYPIEAYPEIAAALSAVASPSLGTL
jgi:hypothetical protein